jgi:hypothetical protein
MKDQFCGDCDSVREPIGLQSDSLLAEIPMAIVYWNQLSHKKPLNATATMCHVIKILNHNESLEPSPSEIGSI